MRSARRLSPRALTIVSVAMMIVPTVTILAMFWWGPPVHEGILEANVQAVDLPPAHYYDVDFRKRSPWDRGAVIITNISDQDWTHLEIRVNKYYSIHNIPPIPAGASRQIPLDHFLSRTGDRFSVRYNQLKNVRVYARRPTKDRATYYVEF